MLFILLICIVAFVALVFAVRGSMGNGKNASAEKAQLSQAELDNCTSQVENAVGRLKIVKDCTDDQISYETPSGLNPNVNAPVDKHCHVFHPNGAGATPCGPYLVSAGCDMTALAVGEEGCGVVYAGSYSGARLYVTNALSDGTLPWGPSGATAASSTTNGTSNTDTLVALGATYQAATFCRTFGPEWYLPSLNELNAILTPGATYIAQSGSLRTSTEANANNAYVLFLSGGSTFNPAGTALLKTNSTAFKCVRRD